MALSTAFYNTFAKRNSIFVAGIFASAFAFGVGFDVAAQSFWDKWNKGRQWKDIRANYIQSDES